MLLLLLLLLLNLPVLLLLVLCFAGDGAGFADACTGARSYSKRVMLTECLPVQDEANSRILLEVSLTEG